jgi:hypothetical protein
LLEVAEGLRDRDVALRWLTEYIDTAAPAGKMLYAGRDVRRRADASALNLLCGPVGVPLVLRDHDRPQHFLYFRPLPHGQTALRPG